MNSQTTSEQTSLTRIDEWKASVRDTMVARPASAPAATSTDVGRSPAIIPDEIACDTRAAGGDVSAGVTVND